jgi:hypothetical protein
MLPVDHYQKQGFMLSPPAESSYKVVQHTAIVCWHMPMLQALLKAADKSQTAANSAVHCTAMNAAAATAGVSSRYVAVPA